MDIEKQMKLDTLGYELDNLKKLHIDLEKQMIKFDEIIPYERQTTAQIFSPRLLNMLLACGPQIESVTKLIAKRCNISLVIIDDLGQTKDKSIPKLIHEINSNSVLSNFQILSLSHNIQFTPFTLHLEWWKKYNDLKHGLSSNQFEINYAVVMDAFSALWALFCLADQLVKVYDEDISKVLDSKNWKSSVGMITISRGDPYADFLKSLLFRVLNVYETSPMSR